MGQDAAHRSLCCGNALLCLQIRPKGSNFWESLSFQGMKRSQFSPSARLRYKVKLLQGKAEKHKGQEAAAASKLWIQQSNIPIECLVGPDCIPDDMWGARDHSEGFCMQLTSPACCKKYLKSQWAGRQSTPVELLTTVLVHKSEYMKHCCWLLILCSWKNTTLDLLHAWKKLHHLQN